MKNKFALSFGLSLIIVGIFSVFFDTDKLIVFAMSISALLFSIINYIISTIYIENDDMNIELLYIIPFIVLMLIICYSSSIEELPISSIILDAKISNFLLFISFGLIFVIEYNNSKQEKSKDRLYNMYIIKESQEYNIYLKNEINEIFKILLEEDKDLDEQIEGFFDEIDNACDERIKRDGIKLDLIKSKKDLYSLRDFDDIYKKHVDVLNTEKIIEKAKKLRKDYRKYIKNEEKKGKK